MLATVLPLVAPVRGRAARPAIEVADADSMPAVNAEGDELLRARGVLQRRAGDRAEDLPTALGRATLRLEGLLASGPTAVEPSIVDPTRAIASAEGVLKATTALFDLIGDEGLVLGEVLSVDLDAVSLEALSHVAEAVIELNTAPRAASRWGSVAAAEAAEVVLQVVAEDLRAAASARQQISQEFTEDIWHVPGTTLRAGVHRWRLISRGRVRRELRELSRTGRARGVTVTVKKLLEAGATRDRIASMAPLLSQHLAELDRGSLTDADATLAAVGAVRRLQASLGDLLDENRMDRLLLADAFRGPDVVSPAIKLRNALRAWSSDIRSMDGVAACVLTQDEVGQWAAEVSELLPALTAGHEATVQLDVPTPTLRDLVEMLLVREHIQDLQDIQPHSGLQQDAHRAGSAS